MIPITECLTSERLKAILAAIPGLKMAVTGDIALDAYWHADMRRAFLSRETPLFPRPVVREAYSPGAGGNVALNLKALGVGEVSVISVVGQDHWASLLKEELARAGIRTEEIIGFAGRRTTTYVKPILMGYNSSQEDARLDFENTDPLPEAAETELLDRIEQRLPAIDAVVIADQLEINGVVSARIRQQLSQLAESNPDKTFLVDSRQRIGLYRHCILKPNWIEAVLALEPSSAVPKTPPEGLAVIGQQLSLRCQRPVFITLSENGVLVCTPERQSHIPAAPVTPPLDPVGAGDAFQAALAASLRAGASAWEAGAFANLAAGITVEKLQQTGTASPGEILERYNLARARNGSG